MMIIDRVARVEWLSDQTRVMRKYYLINGRKTFTSDALYYLPLLVCNTRESR